MKKFLTALIVAATCFATSAFAQFSKGMTNAQLDAAVKQQTTAGKSLSDIANAAIAAGVTGGQLVIALLDVGSSPAAAIAATLRAGGDLAQVINAALAKGVSPAAIQAAATGTGAAADRVQTLIAAAQRSPVSSSSFFASGPSNSSSSSGSTGSGGGGKASGS